MFVGTHERMLDEKGRLALPVAFRSQLGQRGFLVDLEVCLGIYTEDGFREAIDRLNEQVRTGEASQDALRVVSSSAHEVKPDSQGRIVVPTWHREAVGLRNEVVAIGAINRIEIWRPTRWAKKKDAAAGENRAAGSWL